jgi:hypothetical protein
MLSAKILWPLFPLLLLVVIVCLTWGLVRAVRHSQGIGTIALQASALGWYLLAAYSAIASERGGMSPHIHRPFSLLTQVTIGLALVYLWRRDRPLVRLNMTAWVAILADTALHYVLAK